MIRKLLALLGIVFVLFIIGNSCDYGFCKDVDFYDFSKVEFYIRNINPINDADSLEFKIRQLDTHYMANLFKSINLVQNTYALNCDEGWNGMKIPLTRIEITSDSDFNSNHLANDLLNDLILVKVPDNEYLSVYEYTTFDSVEFEKLFPRVKILDPDFYIIEHPTMDLTHRLTVKIFKSNGDTIVAESEQIDWK